MLRHLCNLSRKMVHQIAAEYANSHYDCSCSYFTRKYSISKSTFYNLLKKAIKEGIVSDRTAKLIAEKSSYNSYLKAGEPGKIRSEKYHRWLFQQRSTFLLSITQSRKLAEEYANSHLPKAEFCKSFLITTELFDRTLNRAIIECWISDDVFNMLKQKSFRIHGDSERIVSFWKRLEAKRLSRK